MGCDMIPVDITLRFHYLSPFILGPFHQAVSSTITLTNPSARKLCYKIKTTAPDRYCVKPKSGVIYPREEVNIEGTVIISQCSLNLIIK